MFSRGFTTLSALLLTGFLISGSRHGSHGETLSANRIAQENLEEAFQGSEEAVANREQLEKRLASEERVVRSSDRITDPSVIRMRETDPIVRQKELAQLPFQEATKKLNKKFKLSNGDITRTLFTAVPTGQFTRAAINNCLRATADNIECDSESPYRTEDGTCNNLQNPTWGSALSCQQRLLPANYADDSDEFRVSKNGKPLPPPRTLSLKLNCHLNKPTNDVNHMYMFFGQLLDHDLTLTPVSTTVNNQGIKCCPPRNITHPQCKPILISKDDPFYSRFGITCLNFIRSAICPTCTLGPRQQMDQVTAFIDASFVYGTSKAKTDSLRRKDGTGRLRTQRNGCDELPPKNSDPVNDQCSFPQTNEVCFDTGDSRANQHSLLAALHTLFLREHNRIAGCLQKINPHWSDERIFQETRRIVGAIMQVITYEEYLPITIGCDLMSEFDLWPGEATKYESDTNPSMITEFTTAGFRFGHSLINSVTVKYPLNSTNDVRLLRNEFFQPFDLYEGYCDPLLRGACKSPAQEFDRHLVPDVTNYLYRIRGSKTGLDLASTNINRGRDHGLPTYVQMVRYCSDDRINIRCFKHLVSYGLMKLEEAKALKCSYRYVEDIDLWTRILMEIPNEDAVVGFTVACILAEQFRALKFGDRFYFEHSKQAGSFTYEQLRQIRTVTLSKVMCLNTKVLRLPMNAMLFGCNRNPYIDCRHVKGIDLSLWKE